MTAPLPPLPVENFVDKDGLWDEKYGPYSADEMQSYAKLAVREALERAAKESELVEWTDRKTPPYKRDREPSEIAVAIRAIIEEYK